MTQPNMWMLGLPCSNCGSDQRHTLKCCNVCDHRRRPTAEDIRGLVESGEINGKIVDVEWPDPDNEGEFQTILVVPVVEQGDET